PENLNMMLEFPVILIIHCPGVPLISKCRNTINTKMNENSKFCIGKPLRRFVAGKGFPIIFIFPVLDNMINKFKIFFFFHYKTPVKTYALLYHFKKNASIKPAKI